MFFNSLTVSLTASTVVIIRYRTPRFNKIFGSYFLVFRKCGVTPHRLYCGSSTLKLAISYFSLMWEVLGLPWRERRIYHTLTSISVFSFLSTSPVIRMPKWVHVCRQLDNEVSTWSITTQDWTGLWIPSLNFPLLHQMSWF